MTYLTLENVSKSFDDAEILSDINLEVQQGEFLAIVGFSGSGKTTLINLIAGLQKASSGVVALNGTEIVGPGADRGVVFQTYSLMPWLSVRENVLMAVDEVFPRESRKERLARVEKYVEMVGLGHAMERKPAELSGGMRQRVNVARALAMEPDVLLLDEPLSALDALTRAKLQDEIVDIWARENKTVILITNDVDEALIMADRIIPLKPGPNATLGQEFPVQLPRPRDRSGLNENPVFVSQRAEITNYLLGLGAEQAASGSGKVVELPNLMPSHTEDLPEVYSQKAGTVHKDRYLEFFKVKKIYPTPKGPLTVVDGFDFMMKKGEFISIIGHSGCGKSTVLTMAAGLNDISEGGIVLDGREVHKAGPDRAVVFQAPSLFPWLTALENVMLGIDEVYPDANRKQRRAVAEYYLAKVGLGDALEKRASDLSNGMRQRVGIARAFSLSPKLLLLDEPFGMLDSLTRWDLQEVLMDVWKRTQVTTVCVTHDVDEAILLSDKVVMMTNGPNARIGKVLDVKLPRPRSRAELIAHPDYYYYRSQVLDFLDEYEHGAISKKAPITEEASEAAGADNLEEAA
ncbi:MAG: ABC transporter ATP-binding protein [Alphaproteobacteria bacterium]